MPDERTPARTKGQAPAGEPAAETAAGTGAAAANGSRGRTQLKASADEGSVLVGDDGSSTGSSSAALGSASPVRPPPALPGDVGTAGDRPRSASPSIEALENDRDEEQSKSGSFVAQPPQVDFSPAPGSVPDAGSGDRWTVEPPNVEAQPGQVVRMWCGVWNLHGKKPPADISGWLSLATKAHIYVVGTCECERSIEKSMIWSDKTRWEQQMRNHLGEDYHLIGSHNMSAIHVMVFLHKSLWKYCWGTKTAQVATGFVNYVGNKGSTKVGFNLGHTSVLVMNAHLAAHQNKMKERTQSFTRILRDSPLRNKTSSEVGVHEDYDRVFFMGDLNPRLNAKRDEVDKWLEQRQLAVCLEHDQLSPLLGDDPASARPDGPSGMWPLFEEAPIAFPPTYKFDKNSDTYDSSKKRRVPSWTDRILWKRDPHIRNVAYDSVRSLLCSDHRPILARFEMTVDLGDWTGPPEEVRKDGRSAVCSVQ